MRKSYNLKIFTAAIFAVALMTACGRNEIPKESIITRDPNIPDNLITSAYSEVPAESTELQESESETSASEIVSETKEETEAPETKAPETEASMTNTQDVSEEEQGENIPNTRAMGYLRLFQSKKVHAKYIAANCYDGEEIYTTSVEYYVDGDSAVYNTGSVRRYYQGRQITVIDDDNKFYMVYEEDPEPYIYFGYSPGDYTLVSESDTEEVYDIASDGGVRSTWTFENGKIKVRDIYSDGSFSLYDIEIIDSDTSGMDFTIPAGYDEVDADDYAFYK